MRRLDCSKNYDYIIYRSGAGKVRQAARGWSHGRLYSKTHARKNDAAKFLRKLTATNRWSGWTLTLDRWLLVIEPTEKKTEQGPASFSVSSDDQTRYRSNLALASAKVCLTVAQMLSLPFRMSSHASSAAACRSTILPCARTI